MRILALLPILPLLFGCGSGAPQRARGENRDAQVRAAVNAFYQSFDEGFTRPADYATEDWYHINPYGGVDKGRDATMQTVRAVHQTFLKGTTDKVKDIDIRFASDDVAVATVTSETSPFTSPDGVNHGVEGHLRTFIVVQRGDRWRIMQDHNTTIVPLPAVGTSSLSGSHMTYLLSEAKWGRPYSGPEGYPKGARRAVLTVDPATRGETYFAHFPAGTKFEQHWHSNGEYAGVVKGKVTHVVGSKRTMLQAGDYVALSSQTSHGWEIDAGGDAYLLIRRDGPMDVHFGSR